MWAKLLNSLGLIVTEICKMCYKLHFFIDEIQFFKVIMIFLCETSFLFGVNKNVGYNLETTYSENIFVL